MGHKDRKKSDVRLGLSTLQDISAIILQSHHLDETLENIVTLVAERAHSEVCSLYLMEGQDDTLILSATYGLAAEAGGKNVENASDAFDRVMEQIRDGDVVLVKASRSVGLETVAERLVEVAAS